MTHHRPAMLAAVALALVLSGASGCSKSSNNKTTGPPAGGELGSGNIAGGGGYEHRFFTAGSYPYHCAIHPAQMTGSITVSASAPASDSLVTVTIANFLFSPTLVTIPVGGKVTWVNSTPSTTHTVTSD